MAVSEIVAHFLQQPFFGVVAQRQQPAQGYRAGHHGQVQPVDRAGPHFVLAFSERLVAFFDAAHLGQGSLYDGWSVPEGSRAGWPSTAA